MAGRRLLIDEAARLTIDADPLTEVRITLAWATTGGEKRPVLRFSSKSVIDYRAKAKPLGTLYPVAAATHAQALLQLGLHIEAMTDADDDE